jgi:threonine dehydrogenase-like Zn-dependent dehydrogenase
VKAAYMQSGKIELGALPDPVPQAGEVLVRTLACGVCASDLHVLRHGRELTEWSRAANGPFTMDLDRPVVLGHEYSAEIVDYGPNTQRKHAVGTIVTSTPAVIGAHGIAGIGLSNEYPGGFGEYMLLSEALLRPVPQSLGARLGALTEPVSVGVYYVTAARLRDGDVPLVIGCGAIGLAVIAALRRANARADPRRRLLGAAARAGAPRRRRSRDRSARRVALRGAARRARPANVIFECVGLPGVLDGVTRGAPHGARVMVAGWCLETDRIFTPIAHFKGLTIKFGGGPTPADFDVALRALGDGEIDIEPWISHEAGLDGVEDAFERLGDPTTGLRTLICRDGASPDRRQAPFARPARRRRHPLERLGRDRFAGRERADPHVERREERAHRIEPRIDERRLRLRALALPLRDLACLVDRRDHLPDHPAEPPLEDLLHHAPEVGRGLRSDPCASRHRDAAHELPLDQSPDRRRDVALRLLQLRGDLVERERPRLQIEQREDPALELREDARGCRAGADAVHEDRGRAVH